MLIKNANVLCEDFTFCKSDIEISGDKITGIGQNLTAESIMDCEGLMALPGFIDIHTHGCVGYDTCDGNLEGYKKMCEFYTSKGVTSFLFTSMTLAESHLNDLFKVIDGFCGSQHKGAVPLGIYFEGPFISYEKKGAQSGDNIIPPYIKTLKSLDEASGSRIKVVAVAPEVTGAIDFIKEASKEYKIALAHSAADYDKAVEAANSGASIVTHLYNGMLVPNHRAPGVPGAAFDCGLYTEIICDGFHVHPSVVRSTFKVAGEDRVILISDSMQAAGMPDGKYILGGQDVFVSGGKATLENGVLAGSSSNMHQLFKNVVQWGIPVEAAAKAASINPAKAIGVDNFTGSISIGKMADIILLDKDLNIHSVITRGLINSAL